METKNAMSTSTDAFVRVERGEADAEELAAVTAVLLARAAATNHHPPRPRRTTATWRRLERAPGFHAPHSWQV
jgi:hypothetical protein